MNVKSILDKLNITDSEKKSFLLKQYMDGILEWNEKINLTAITDRDEFMQKHILDSLLCAGSVEFASSDYIIDVGTGGGFPGIPLAVCFPEKKFVLMDSLAKRLKVIDILCSQLGIINVSTLHGRAEDIGKRPEYREKFDVCVSRAVAEMRILSEYCIPLLKTGGFFIAYKGPDCISEINDSSNAICSTGGNLIRVDDVSSDNDGCCQFRHSLVYVEKVKSTPDKYPRRAGMPSKKPL